MLFNRHHIRSFGQALLVLLAFASCINDDFADDNVTGADSEGDPWYLGLQVQVDASGVSTRATGNTFESGTHGEHEISPKGNYVILFDDKEKLFGVYPLAQSLQGYEHKDNSEDSGYEDEPDNTREGSYLRLLHVYPRKGKLPESCLVILNANNAISEKLEGYDKTGRTGMSLDDVLKEVWEWEKDGEKEKAKDPKRIGFVADNNGTDYFTMTNSVYIGENNVIKDVVSIKNKIYPTIQEALKNRTTVYVERMVAKCTFELSDDLKKDNDEKDCKKIIKPIGAAPLVFFEGFDKEGTIEFVSVRDWRINITGWGINALETQNYLFKNINNKNYFDDWNAKDNYRSYWSEDPHYDVDRENPSERLVYPWQYRRAIDDPEIRYYSKLEEAGHHNILKNYSYYDFEFENHEGENNEHNVESFDFEKTVYVPENTYDKAEVAGYGGKDGHDSRDELLAGTHLLIGAELEVYDNDADNGRYRIYDLYRDRNGIYYESERECFVSLVHSFNQSLTSQTVLEFTPYDWENGGRIKEKNNHTLTEKDTLVASTGGSFMLCYKYDDSNYVVLDEAKLAEIMKPDAENDSIWFAEIFGSLASAEIRNGDGKRFPWLKESIDNKKLAIKKVVKNEEGKMVPVNGNLPIHKKGKNSYGATIAYGDPLWDDADANDVKSMLYEWLGAVDHFNNGKMYYATGIDNTPDIKLKSDKTYGVVRNNWYQFKLTKLKSIGVPVDDPTQPIVPDFVSNNDQINVSIYILPWHEVKGDAPVFFW